ncbi:DUF423-domain-containing protein [Punctularia strigosozonata HHB-11173 SS5]|uniref:DUF423-domain-containing protein n=1 Tax=Punctularia strigosozonata (strain HHB-11173) TaxID=741275 RepID=UPI0004418073|nr:DUF423-domain-containing protein [Punctularia strigosozonata HHB-11173 SS5]EIN14191.1 DUF423-domain-containing protein [Punctularia strigosozonata HHB-11173 SS5]
MLSNPASLWRAGALIAATGVITGAFGAHGLRRRPGVTQDNIHAWETAAHYSASPRCGAYVGRNSSPKPLQVFNGLALMLVSLHPRFASHRFAGPAIAAGSVVFSGSIFALVLNRDRFKWLGPVTPIGGLAMIAG